MEYYGNRMWNNATDNTYKSKLLMDRQSFDNFSKILEAAEMNFYACVKENKVVVAINKSDTPLCKRLIGKQLADKVSFQDSNKPYSPPEMNVFGSEYKYIPHKRHFKVIGGANTDNSDALLRAAQRLQEMRIQFSGRVYADKTTLTVRSEDFAMVEAAYHEVCRRRSEVYLNMPDEKDMFGTVKYTDIQNVVRIPSDISAERFNSIRTYLDNMGAEYAAMVNNGKVILWLDENKAEEFNDLVIKSDNIRINSEYMRNSGYRTEQITALRKYIDFCADEDIDIDFFINMIKPEYTNSQNSAIGDLFIQIYSQFQSERFMDSNGYYTRLNDMQSEYDNIVTLKRLCANRDYNDEQILELLNALEADISASVLSELDESYSSEEIREFTELFNNKKDSKKTLDNIDGFFERHLKKVRMQAVLDNLNDITEGHSYSDEQRYELLNALMSGVPNSVLSEISEDTLPEEIRSITETHRFYDSDKINELFDVDMARELISYNGTEDITSAPVGQKSDERKSLYSIEQNGELSEYINNSHSLFELLQTYASSETPYVALSECGNRINSDTFAEIQQSGNFSFSVEMNVDENVLRIYKVDGNISEPERTNDNSTIEEYDLAMVKDLVNNICKEASDIAVCKQLLSDRLENCRIAEDPINSVAPQSTFILSATNNIPNEIRENAKKSLVVNLYGGPGAGKSTAALQLDTSVPFENEGRIHNLEESMEKDGEILSLLNSNNIKFEMFDRDNISKIAEENSHRLSAESEPELTEMEQAFINYDIESVMAKSPLAWDEIEDIGYILFGEKYINKYPASEKAIYGNGLHEPELYDIARRMQDGEDIRKELVSALLGGQKSFTTPNNNTFKVEYGESDFIAKYGNAQKSVSYEALGDAFLSLIKGKYNDIVNARTIEGLKYDISDITEEKAESLIKAFDGAALHGWEKGDNQPKINRIKKALFNILGDEEQTEKAFNDIAWDKYDVKIEDKNADELNFHFGYADHDDDWFTESNLLGDFVEEHPNMSFALANSIMEYLDEKQHSERDIKELNAGWYKKTNFVITARVDRQDFHFADRFDIGDGKGTGGGSLIDHIKTICENIVRTNQYPYNTPESKEKATSMLEKFVPFLEKHSALTPDEQKILNEFKMNNPIRTAFDIETNKNLSEKTEVKQDVKKISDIGREMLLFQSDLAEKYKYKPIPPMFSAEYRKKYKDTIPSFLNIDGDDVSLYSLGGTKICESYDRIVIGDYGAFIEISPKKAAIENFKAKEGEEYRINDPHFSDSVKYHWLTAKDNSDCKIYYQQKGVSYADYKPFKYYISPFEVQAFEREKVRDVQKLQKIDKAKFIINDFYEYHSIKDMIENGLTGLDFSDLVSVPESVIEKHTAKDKQTLDFMSGAADVADISSEYDMPSVTLKYKGDVESLDEIRNKALSLGDTVIFDNAEDTISIDTYDNHKAELDGFAFELGLVAISEEDKHTENILSKKTFEQKLKEGDIVTFPDRPDIWRVSEISDMQISFENVDENSPNRSFSHIDFGANREKLQETLKYVLVPDVEAKNIDVDDVSAVTFKYKGDAESLDEIKDKAQNFTITDDKLGEGGEKTKFKANIEAIRTLKQLEAENRPATADEKESLSKYVGWGGLQNAFDSSKEKWADEYVQLKELLTDEEYSSARASTLDSFYTAPVIIDGIYKALNKFGFTGGNVLEPALGVGNFIGRMPEEMSKHTKFYGTELDSISGRIAQKLYPNADIKIEGFEKNTYQDSCFDVAVGNVPFGNLGFNDDKHGTNKLHDYFFAETLDKVKDGGIVAFVTSTGTLDKKDESVRKMLSEKADLIGAVRLPSGAFKANAGTDVTSDIIFLKKRSTPQEEIPDWVHIGESENGLPVNKYFADNPDMILGDLVVDTNPRSSGTKVVPIEGADLKEQISQAVAGLSARISNERANEVYAQTKKGAIIPPDNLRNSSFFINDDGRICFKGIHGECSVWDKDYSKASHARASAYIHLRDMTRVILKAQENNCTDEQLAALQSKLNKLYDDFYNKYGLLHSRGNKTYFRHDVSYPLVCSLERKYDKDKLVEKSDLFTKRTIKPPVPVTHVDTAQEALIMSMAEHACVDLDYMAKLSDIPKNVLIEELRGEIYPVPELSHGGNIVYQEASEYLSGDIRIKLDNAIKAAKEDPLYSANVAALNKAMPEPLKAGDIDVKLGAIWIDPKYYQQFMYEVFKTPDIYRADKSKSIWRRKNSDITIEYSDFTGAWHINNKGEDNSINVIQTYGASFCHAYDILEDALNLKEPKLYKTIRDSNGKDKRVIDLRATKIVQQKCRKIHEAFKAWIFSDPERRSELVNKYNSMYNSIRPREYDGSHLSFPGMNTDIQLHSHQKNAIAHALYGGNTLFAHSVGAGKTFEMIATAMESKRLGLCTKSLFAVPNHLTEQIGDDFMRLYPNANILVATKNDFKKENRRQLVAKIATGNFDAVIIGHSQLGMIPISKERQEAQLNEQINDIVSGIELLKREEGSSYQIKSMERTKKSIQKQLDKLKKEKQDNTVTFEQLGVDKLFVDEAHEFKNLFCATKLQNVAGISSSASQRALDLFMKCRYLDEKTGGKGVVFATGTPISNSVTELHTMMRYLQYDFLRSKNLHHFDNWVSIFGKQKTDYELAPTGNSYRPRTRIASYANLPELMSMFKQCADVKTADMLDLDVPECEMHVVNAEPTEFQKTLVSELADRADEVQKGSVDPSIDNMLRITGDGRKVGLDPRLIDPSFADDPQSKLNQCIKNVLQIHKDTESEKLSQIIFCDLGVPKGRNVKNAKNNPENEEEPTEKSVSETDSLEEECDFCVYDDIKTKLIAGGVPENEIAFIHDAPTEKAKAELFEKVRSGEVRILIGSTGKMGTGTNVQDKLIAMHDLDIPWRPADLEQRMGRMVRQGNENDKVNLYRYVTKGTFDAYSYQLLESKQRFISQIITSKTPARSCEDVDQAALSYSEIKALCTGDERIKELMVLDNEVKDLNIMAADYRNTHYDLEDSIKKYQAQIKSLYKYKNALEVDKKMCEGLPVDPETGKAAFKITIDKKVYTDKTKAAKALEDVAMSLAQRLGTDPTPVVIGNLHGFPISINYDPINLCIVGSLNGTAQHSVELTTSYPHNLRKLENLIFTMDSRSEECNEKISRLKIDIEDAEKLLSEPFTRGAELHEKTERLTALRSELNNEAAENLKNNPNKQRTYYFDMARINKLSNNKSASAQTRSKKFSIEKGAEVG